MTAKNLMGCMVSLSDAAPKHTEAAPKKRPRNARMESVAKHVHTSERFSFASVAAAVRGAREKKQKN